MCSQVLYFKYPFNLDYNELHIAKLTQPVIPQVEDHPALIRCTKSFLPKVKDYPALIPPINPFYLKLRTIPP